MIVGSEVAQVVKDMCDRVVGWWLEQEGWSGIPQIDEGLVQDCRQRETLPRAWPRSMCAGKGELEISRQHEPPQWQVFDDQTYQGVAYPTYGWGADVVELVVDPDTLETKLDQVTAVCEVGQSTSSDALPRPDRRWHAAGPGLGL